MFSEDMNLIIWEERMMRIFTLLGAMLDDLSDIDYSQAITTSEPNQITCTFCCPLIVDLFQNIFGQEFYNDQWKFARIIFKKSGDNYTISSLSLISDSGEIVINSEIINDYLSEICADSTYWKMCKEVVSYAKISC